MIRTTAHSSLCRLLNFCDHHWMQASSSAVQMPEASSGSSITCRSPCQPVTFDLTDVAMCQPSATVLKNPCVFWSVAMPASFGGAKASLYQSDSSTPRRMTLCARVKSRE